MGGGPHKGLAWQFGVEVWGRRGGGTWGDLGWGRIWVEGCHEIWGWGGVTIQAWGGGDLRWGFWGRGGDLVGGNVTVGR